MTAPPVLDRTPGSTWRGESPQAAPLVGGRRPGMASGVHRILTTDQPEYEPPEWSRTLAYHVPSWGQSVPRASDVAPASAQTGFPIRMNLDLMSDDPIAGVAGPLPPELMVQLGAQAGEQRGGFYRGLATAPITLANFPTYGREGGIALLTSVLGKDYQQRPGALIGEEPPLAGSDPLDLGIFALRQVGNIVDAPFRAAADWWRDSNNFNRAKQVRELAQTGSTTPFAVDWIVGSIFPGEADRFTYQKLYEKAQAEGIDVVDMLSTAYDISPTIVSQILTNPNLSDEALGELMRGQPISLDPGVALANEGAFFMGTLAVGAFAGGGLGAVGKAIGLGARAGAGLEAGMVAARTAKVAEAGTRLQGLLGPSSVPGRFGAAVARGALEAGGTASSAGRALSLGAGITRGALKANALMTTSGWTIRGLELGLKQAAGMLGNQELVDMMDRLLWQMPLSMNPGLNLIDGFGFRMTSPLRVARIAAGSRRVEALEVSIGRQGSMGYVGGIGTDATGRYIRIAGRERRIGDQTDPARAVVRLREMTPEQLHTSFFAKVGWSFDRLDEMFGPGNPRGLTWDDARNTVLYLALQTVREAKGELGRFEGAHLPDIRARSEEFWMQNAARALQVLDDEFSGRSSAMAKLIKGQFWTLDKLNDSDMAATKARNEATYLPDIALSDFVSWTAASKILRQAIERGDEPSTAVLGYRRTVSLDYLATFRQHLADTYQPKDVVKVGDIELLRRYGGNVESHGKGSRLRRKGRTYTRTEVEEILTDIEAKVRGEMAKAERAEAAVFKPGRAVGDVFEEARVLGIATDQLDAIRRMRELPTEQLPPPGRGILEAVARATDRTADEILAQGPQKAWQDIFAWVDDRLAQATDTALMRDRLTSFEQAVAVLPDDSLRVSATRAIRRINDELLNPLSPRHRMENENKAARWDRAHDAARALVARIDSHIRKPERRLSVVASGEQRWGTTSALPSDVLTDIDALARKVAGDADAPIRDADRTLLASDVHPLSKLEALQRSVDPPDAQALAATLARAGMDSEGGTAAIVGDMRAILGLDETTTADDVLARASAAADAYAREASDIAAESVLVADRFRAVDGLVSDETMMLLERMQSYADQRRRTSKQPYYVLDDDLDPAAQPQRLRRQALRKAEAEVARATARLDEANARLANAGQGDVHWENAPGRLPETGEPYYLVGRGKSAYRSDPADMPGGRTAKQKKEAEANRRAADIHARTGLPAKAVYVGGGVYEVKVGRYGPAPEPPPPPPPPRGTPEFDALLRQQAVERSTPAMPLDEVGAALDALLTEPDPFMGWDAQVPIVRGLPQATPEYLDSLRARIVQRQAEVAAHDVKPGPAYTETLDALVKAIDDEAKARLTGREGVIETAMREGRVEESQAANVEVGVERGGTPESGGAIRAEEPIDVAARLEGEPVPDVPDARPLVTRPTWRVDTPEYRRDYNRGWTYSGRPDANLDYADAKGWTKSSAWEDGYADRAADRAKYHLLSLDEEGRPYAGEGGPEAPSTASQTTPAPEGAPALPDVPADVQAVMDAAERVRQTGEGWEGYLDPAEVERLRDKPGYAGMDRSDIALAMEERVRAERSPEAIAARESLPPGVRPATVNTRAIYNEAEATLGDVLGREMADLDPKRWAAYMKALTPEERAIAEDFRTRMREVKDRPDELREVVREADDLRHRIWTAAGWNGKRKLTAEEVASWGGPEAPTTASLTTATPQGAPTSPGGPAAEVSVPREAAPLATGPLRGEEAILRPLLQRAADQNAAAPKRKAGGPPLSEADSALAQDARIYEEAVHGLSYAFGRLDGEMVMALRRLTDDEADALVRTLIADLENGITTGGVLDWLRENRGRFIEQADAPVIEPAVLDELVADAAAREAGLPQPGPLYGKETAFPDRAPTDPFVPARFRVVDIDELAVQGPDSPLQPRDRAGRAASKEQVRGISREFRPELAFRTESGAHGPQVVSSDLRVVAGNGRTLAMREMGPEQWATYRAMLLERADEFGIDPAQVDMIERPVLVREIPDEYVTPEMAAWLNAETGAMAPAEMAVAIARQMSPEDIAAIGELGETVTLRDALTQPSKAPFVRRVLDALPEQQRATFMDADGNLSAEGAKMLSDALLARMIPAPDIVSKLIEHPEVGTRFRNALEMSLGKVLVAEERLHLATGIDAEPIGEVLADAMRIVLGRLEAGMSIKDLRGDLMTEGLFEVTRGDKLALALAMTDNQNEMAAILRGYARATEAAMQEGMFDQALPSLSQRINAGIDDVNVSRMFDQIPRLPETDAITIHPFTDTAGNPARAIEVPVASVDDAIDARIPRIDRFDQSPPADVLRHAPDGPFTWILRSEAEADAMRRWLAGDDTAWRGDPVRVEHDGTVAYPTDPGPVPDEWLELRRRFGGREDVTITAADDAPAGTTLVSRTAQEVDPDFPVNAGFEPDLGPDVRRVQAAADSGQPVVVSPTDPVTQRVAQTAVGAPRVRQPAGLLIINEPDTATMLRVAQEDLAAAQARHATATEALARARAEADIPDGTPLDATTLDQWDRYVGGTLHPTTMGAVHEVLESIDAGMPPAGAMEASEIIALRNSLLAAAHRRLDGLGAQRVNRAGRPFQPDPTVMIRNEDLGAALRAVDEEIQRRIITDDASPMEGWEGTQYEVVPAPRQYSATGELLAPRILPDDYLSRLDDIVPGLADEILSGRKRSWTQRVEDTHSTFLMRALDHIIGARSERELTRAAIDNFTNELLSYLPDAQSFTPQELARMRSQVRGMISHVHLRMVENTTGWGGFLGLPSVAKYRRVGQVPRETLERWFREAIGDDRPAWFDRILVEAETTGQKFPLAEAWRLSDNRVRQFFRDRPGPIASWIENAYAGGLGQWGHDQAVALAQLYNAFRFAFDARWIALEKTEAFILTLGKEGWEAVQDARNMTPDRMPLAFGVDDLARQRTEWAWWLGVMDTGGWNRSRERYIMALMKRRQGREFPSILKEMAKQDEALAEMIRVSGDTPEGWLAKLSQDITMLAERGRFHPEAEMRVRLDPYLKRGVISQKEFDDALARGYWTDIPSLDAEIAYAAGTPVQPLLERLAFLNQQYWQDSASLIFGQVDRSNLQRLFNHPMLYWPLSYQIKATKWLAGLMLDQVGGLPTGALGAVTLGRLHEQHKEWVATVPGYAERMASNRNLLFMAQMILPITPWDIGVSLSPFTRLAMSFISGDASYTRNLFGVGPGYTYFEQLPRVLREQSREDALLQGVPIVGDVVRRAQVAFPFRPPAGPVGLDRPSTTSGSQAADRRLFGDQPLPQEPPPVAQPRYGP